MSADDILKIIDSIPEYITYFYPGYLIVYVYYFLRGKTLKDSKAIIVKSLAISYVLKTILSYLFATGLNNYVYPSEININLMLIFMSITIAYISFRLVKTSIVTKVFGWLKIETTFYDNEMEILADFDKGAWLVVYLHDDKVVYEGALGFKEMEEDKRKYITLNAYRKYLLNKKGKPQKPYIKDYEDEKEAVMIFYDSIKRIEKRNIEQ